MNRFISLLFVALIILSGCSLPALDEVLSDNRTEYEKSQSLPPLEVPPDLRASEPNDAMTIPGETTTASLKGYQNRETGQAAPQPGPLEQAPVQQSQVFQAAAPTVVADSAQGAFVVVRGDRQGTWNRMRSFMTGLGYTLELDDFELGYMETGWSAPVTGGGQNTRDKYKLYSEAGADQDVVVFYLENTRQVQTAQGWYDQGRDPQAERLLAAEMNSYFSGDQGQVAAAAPVTYAVPADSAPVSMGRDPGMRAEVQDIGDNKLLLAIPEEYTLAWRRTEQALHMAGMTINRKDQDRGLYEVTYFTEEEDSGWTSKLKKLKFWGNDDKKGVAYQIALTGVGNKTELILLDAKGDWEDIEQTQSILTMLQDYYNRLM